MTMPVCRERGRPLLRQVPNGRRHPGQRGSATLRGAAGKRGPWQIHEAAGKYLALWTKSQRRIGVPGKPSIQRRGASRPHRLAAASGVGKVLRSGLLGPCGSSPPTNQPPSQATAGPRRCPQAAARRIGGSQNARICRPCSGGRHGLGGFARLAALTRAPSRGGAGCSFNGATEVGAAIGGDEESAAFGGHARTGRSGCARAS
jgi:hypothetical protein